MNDVLRGFLGLGGAATGGILFIILGLSLLALKFTVIGFIIYFFLAAMGFVPPMEVIPWIPYI